MCRNEEENFSVVPVSGKRNFKAEIASGASWPTSVFLQSSCHRGDSDIPSALASVVQCVSVPHLQTIETITAHHDELNKQTMELFSDRLDKNLDKYSTYFLLFLTFY